MGLKKDPAAPGGADPVETKAAAPVAPTKPATPAPAAKPAESPQHVEAATPDKSGGRSMFIRAVKRPLSDPYTGIVYVLNAPRPGVFREGNWLDAQLRAGVLVECAATDIE